MSTQQTNENPRPQLADAIGSVRWRSCAKWAPALRFDHDITTDTHDTKEQAEAVCSMLRQWGLGG